VVLEARLAEAENPGESGRGVEKEHPVDEERPAEGKQSEGKESRVKKEVPVDMDRPARVEEREMFDLQRKKIFSRLG
jgi:hypothetical protein